MRQKALIQPQPESQAGEVIVFQERSVITKHLRNVFKEVELEESAVRAKIAHTALDGKTYQTQFYNLDAILSPSSTATSG